MGIIAAIGNGFKAVASFFSWAGKRSDLNNTPAMVANASAGTDAKAQDQAAKDVANPDTTNLEKELS